MPLLYPIKHVYRNWKLFTALLIGITLAATFFAGIGVKSNLAAEQALDKQISYVLTDMEFSASLNQSNLPLAYKNITNVAGVKQVDMVARFSSPIGVPSDNYTSHRYSQLAAFPDDSRIHNEWINRPDDGIPENYTYLIKGTGLANDVQIGDNITAMITFPQPKYYNQTTIYLNLTVAGFADLTDNGYAYLSGNNFVIYDSRFSGSSVVQGPYGNYRSETLMVGWDSTFKKLWNTTLDSSSTAEITFSISVDRQNLISPWNVQESVDKVNQIADKIQNQVMANYLAHGYVNNMLGNTLNGYQFSFDNMIFQFFIVSIPIFFVAWYLGSTVSDVSFNIRRREIGSIN